jgi:hypothetical protein
MGERLEKLVIFNEGTLKKGGLNGAPPVGYQPPKPQSFSHPKPAGNAQATGSTNKPASKG